MFATLSGLEVDLTSVVTSHVFQQCIKNKRDTFDIPFLFQIWHRYLF